MLDAPEKKDTPPSPDTADGAIHASVKDAVAAVADIQKQAGEQVKQYTQASADHAEWMRHFQDRLDALAALMPRKGPLAE